MKAWRKWRMCGRKKAFYTQSTANKAARKFDGYTYECPICFCWHTTKKVQPKGPGKNLIRNIEALKELRRNATTKEKL